MASIGHVAIGMAAAQAYRAGDGRPSYREMALWSLLSLAPDADVIGFSLGVEYGDPWGHRGATHSLLFSVGLALLVAALARVRRQSFTRTAAVAAPVLVSHALLDTLTDGGLGCALLWPFDLTRYFAPWNPIPVAPIGLAFFTPGGLFVSLVELVLFAPVVVYALPAARAAVRRRRWIVAPWLATVWLVASTDPIRESVIGFILRDDTEFAPGFSSAAFDQINIGDASSGVRERLGQPLREAWFYPVDSAHGCEFVLFEGAGVARAQPLDLCDQEGVATGVGRSEVEQRLGSAEGACLQFSRSPSGRAFRMRGVCFADGKVEQVMKMWARD